MTFLHTHFNLHRTVLPCHPSSLNDPRDKGRQHPADEPDQDGRDQSQKNFICFHRHVCLWSWFFNAGLLSVVDGGVIVVVGDVVEERIRPLIDAMTVF